MPSDGRIRQGAHCGPLLRPRAAFWGAAIAGLLRLDYGHDRHEAQTPMVLSQTELVVFYPARGRGIPAFVRAGGLVWLSKGQGPGGGDRRGAGPRADPLHVCLVHRTNGLSQALWRRDPHLPATPLVSRHARSLRYRAAGSGRTPLPSERFHWLAFSEQNCWTALVACGKRWRGDDSRTALVRRKPASPLRISVQYSFIAGTDHCRGGPLQLAWHEDAGSKTATGSGSGDRKARWDDWLVRPTRGSLAANFAGV